MPTAKPTAQRKRNRKRKRRLASSSSSSLSSPDSSDSSSDQIPNTATIKRAPLKEQATPSSEDESSSSSTSLSSSDSENDVKGGAGALASPSLSSAKPPPSRPNQSPSPSPPSPDVVPPFLAPAEGSNNQAQDEQALRNRFRQFWMASVAEAFGDDLEQIRKVRAPRAFLSLGRFFFYLPHRSHTFFFFSPIAGAEYDRIASCFVDRFPRFWW
jgi:ribosome assembly protein 3